MGNASNQGLGHVSSKYSEARHKAVVEAVRAGNFRATAARLAGIAPNALYRWLDRGQDASEANVPYDDPTVGAYRRLFEEVEEAEAQFEASMVERVVDASEEESNWTAALAILERTRPHKFAKRSGIVIEGGAPVKIATLHIITTPDSVEAANSLLKSLARPSEREPQSIEAELARVAESARF